MELVQHVQKNGFRIIKEKIENCISSVEEGIIMKKKKVCKFCGEHCGGKKACKKKYLENKCKVCGQPQIGVHYHNRFDIMRKERKMGYVA